MTIGIVGGIVIPAVERLRDALVRRGHEVRLIDLAGISAQCFEPGYWANALGDCDLVYYRNGLGDAGRTLLGEELVASRVIFINPVYHRHPLCQDKAYQAMVARRNGIPIPQTYIGRHTPFSDLRTLLGLPYIAKGTEGTRGEKVFLIGSEEEHRQCLTNLPGDMLFQKRIPNSGDFRVFVIGASVWAIFKRIPPPGGFRANISLGGTGERVTDPALREALSRIALSMTAALSIDIAGIDVIQSSDDGSLYLLESNTNPDWKGLDEALGTDTAERIASYFEECVRAATPGVAAQ